MDGQPPYTVTKAKAQAILDEVRTIFDGKFTVMLYPPGFHDPRAYVIAGDGGPEDWVHLVTSTLNGDRQNAIFVEPVNHWSVALYPPHCHCGQASKANWYLQLALVPSGGDQTAQDQQQLNLYLCHDHKGEIKDHIPAGCELAGKNLVALR